jgi:Carboxypeptidase regulatory-like domain
MVTRLSFLLLLALPLAMTASAATPMTKIRVEVRSTVDKPIERASVIITLDKGRSAVKLGKKVRTHWEMRTNQEGVATIPPLPQGSFLIQVTAKGYQTFGQHFDVKEEEKTIEVKLNAPQPQYSAH